MKEPVSDSEKNIEQLQQQVDYLVAKMKEPVSDSEKNIEQLQQQVDYLVA